MCNILILFQICIRSLQAGRGLWLQSDGPDHAVFLLQTSAQLPHGIGTVFREIHSRSLQCRHVVNFPPGGSSAILNASLRPANSSINSLQGLQGSQVSQHAGQQQSTQFCHCVQANFDLFLPTGIRLQRGRRPVLQRIHSGTLPIQLFLHPERRRRFRNSRYVLEEPVRSTRTLPTRISTLLRHPHPRVRLSIVFLFLFVFLINKNKSHGLQSNMGLFFQKALPGRTAGVGRRSARHRLSGTLWMFCHQPTVLLAG